MKETVLPITISPSAAFLNRSFDNEVITFAGNGNANIKTGLALMHVSKYHAGLQ